MCRYFFEIFFEMVTINRFLGFFATQLTSILFCIKIINYQKIIFLVFKYFRNFIIKQFDTIDKLY